MNAKFLILTVILFATLASYATLNPGSERGVTKTITVNSDYYKIVVGENLKVIFVDDDGLNLKIEGNAAFESSVNVSVKEHTLFLSINGRKREGTVYVPVRKNVSEILVKADSKVYSEGFLKCKNLSVVIAEGAYAHIKNMGRVAYTGQGNELEFEKYQEISL